MRDEQTNQRGIMQVFRDVALQGASVVTGRPIVKRCPACNEWVMKDDEHSACGEHQPIPEGANPIYMTFVPALPAEKELPPPVERLDGKPAFKRVNMKQRDERYKIPESDDPLAHVPPKRDDGGYVRKVGLQGDRDPFTRAQERRAAAFDYEPQVGDKELADYEDDMIFDEPHYELEER